MNPALNGIWEHILDLGLGALAHANRHAAYAAMSNHRWHDLSVLQAAHAAELLIKARIAQEHPLLIFESLPRSTQVQVKEGHLDLEDLFQQGRTFQWQDLPERLWATTGIHIPDKDKYDKFGKLRNGIQHFASSQQIEPSHETLSFVFDFIDPFINQCWELYAIDYDEDHEPYTYFTSTLVEQGILFLVSPKAAEQFENWEVDWSSTRPSYRKEMLARVKKARTDLEG